jgi:hypothetical protein
VGKVVQPLPSVNYNGSHAHDHERHGPFTRLVGGYGWDSFGWATRSSRSGSWYVVGAKHVCMGLGLATSGMPFSSVGLPIGEMPVSSVGFGYRWDAYEHWSVWL